MTRKRLVTLLTSLLLSVLAISIAVESGFQIRLSASDAAGASQHLVDNQGRTIYAFLPEGPAQESAVDATACDEACLAQWVPITVVDDSVDDAWVGEGLDRTKLSVVERADGGFQLAYAGWPLYHFAGDAAAGDTNGEGMAGLWFLVSAAGELLGQEPVAEGEDPEAEAEAPDTEAPDTEAPDTEAGDIADLMAAGETVFRSGTTPPCSTCHGSMGEGRNGPTLVGSRIVANTSRLIRTIVNGGQMMPSFGHALSDADVAAVATFVRNSWGNSYGPVTSEEVTSQR